MPLSLAMIGSFLSNGAMASSDIQVPFGEGPEEALDSANAAVQRHWPSVARLSSLGGSLERFLANAGFDKGPWLAAAFAAGIALWFLLDHPWQWSAILGGCAIVAIAAASVWRDQDERVHLRQAALAISLMIALGLSAIWLRSEVVGAEPIERPQIGTFNARILERDEQPAQNRVRLVLAIRDAETGQARKVRVNVPIGQDKPQLTENTLIRLRARLMPPAGPMLPGGYDFARSAWFQGLSATGSVLGEIEIVDPALKEDWLAHTQRRLAGHVLSKLDGSAGAIASALVSGDRGSITNADEEAMRDAGLTHLLSISGLHVSAVIAAAYLLGIKLLALWPWLALRVRLPLVAAGVAALAGVGYTLLTGAEVPTVRSCIGAILVLAALALGREPLSLRMVAAAALFVLFLWPESLVGPSFQMSFAAVLAIVALHNSAPVKAFLAPREESWFARSARRTWMLLVTGFVIEIALMPIVMFHFHRAGVYGAFANVIGIPLTTFFAMPFIALALLLDIFGLGAPAWWAAGKSLDLLIGIAHFTAAQPGAVKLMPEMGNLTFSIFVAGGLWIGLWRGKVRLLGLLPVSVATAMFLLRPTPDILISSDGQHVGIMGEGDQLLVLRESRSDYAKDNLLELAGMDGEPIALDAWPAARCTRDFCTLSITRERKVWRLLMAKSSNRVEERALAAACDRSDIVIANRYLPRSCQPRWLKADRRLLDRKGGLSLDLKNSRYDAVADSQGEHGWWTGKGR